MSSLAMNIAMNATQIRVPNPELIHTYVEPVVRGAGFQYADHRFDFQAALAFDPNIHFVPCLTKENRLHAIELIWRNLAAQQHIFECAEGLWDLCDHSVQVDVSVYADPRIAQCASQILTLRGFQGPLLALHFEESARASLPPRQPLEQWL